MISGTQNSMELLGKSKEELREFCVALGEPAFRGTQIYHALYAERKFDVAQVTNLPAALRERLSKEARITLPEVQQRFASADGSARYLYALPAGGKETARPASVEAVFMPSEGRQTICISTQAGCAVDCHFCLTAQLGLIRNLPAGEILAQVLLPLEEAHQGPQSENKDGGLKPAATKSGLAPQTNIVLMGQGEPLLNFEPVMAAVRIILDPAGLGISPKHVTLSTSGIVPGIERMALEKVRPKLAISLNASNDEPEDARRVVRLLSPLKSVKVNLIPWNPGELPYRESSEERIEEFRRILVERGVPAFVRYSRGRDVMAACGQLALLQIDGGPLSVVSPQ